MAGDERIGFCNICEAFCGIVATVQDGRLTGVRPDRENPVSKGFICPKGMALAEIANDPDRVTQPLRRRPDGTFETVSWDVALDEIGARMRAIADRDGRGALGVCGGNPTGWNYQSFLWMLGLMRALGSKHWWGGAAARFVGHLRQPCGGFPWGDVGA